MALAFEEDKVLIFFGPSVPNELREMSVVHEVQSFAAADFHAGATLQIGDATYEITAVGHEAAEKMEQLAHVVVYFTDVPDEILPGAMYATPHQLPNIEAGMKITIG